jgi:hypothetical protein
MTTTADRRAKMLERVRALLAKADSTTFEHEADTFRAKADELMRLYAIEQWQVDQADEGTSREPEVRYVGFEWWYRSNHRDNLWLLFTGTARHCRCVVATRGHGVGDASFYTIPVIGLPSDLDYFDLLFTHLMLQLGKQLGEGVHPVPGASLGENARRLRETGMQRAKVCRMLWEGGYVELGQDTMERYGITPETEWGWLPQPAEKAIRAKVRKAGEAYEKEHGLESTTGAHPATWQRSFAEGFTMTVRRRFREMTAKYDADDTSGSMALAVRDITQVAEDLYNQLFPEPEQVEVKGRRSRALTYKEPKHDSRAYAAGSQAGRDAKLVARSDRGVGGSSRQLGEGS